MSDTAPPRLKPGSLRYQEPQPTQTPYAVPPPPPVPMQEVPDQWPTDPVEQERVLRAIEFNLREHKRQADHAFNNALVPGMQQQALLGSEELGQRMMAQPPRTPDLAAQYEQEIQGLQPFLQPERVEGLRQQAQRLQFYSRDAAAFEQKASQWMTQNVWPWLPETQTRPSPFEGRITGTQGYPAEGGSQVLNPSTGQWEQKPVGEPFVQGLLDMVGGEPSLRGYTAKALSKLADEEVMSRFGPEGMTPYQETVQRMAQKMPAGASRQGYRAVLADTIRGLIERRVGQKETRFEEASKWGGPLGFMVPAMGVEKLFVKVASKIPALAKAAGGLTWTGKLLAHVVGPAAAQAAYALGRPLDADDALQVESAPESRRANLEAALRWRRASREALAMPLMLLGAKAGAITGGPIGTALTTVGVGLAGEAGEAATHKVADVLREAGVESTPQELADLYAVQGTYGHLHDALKAKTGADRWEALKHYAEDAMPMMATFGAIQTAGSLYRDFRFATRAKALEAARVAKEEVKQAGVEGPVGDELEQAIDKQVEDMMPSQEEDARRAATEKVVEVTGGDEQRAQAELHGQAFVEKFFGHVKGATLKEKRAELARQAVETPSPVVTAEQDQIRADAMALHHVEKAMEEPETASQRMERAHELIEERVAREQPPETEPTRPTRPEETAAKIEEEVANRTPQLAEPIVAAQEPGRVIGVDEPSGTRLVRVPRGTRLEAGGKPEPDWEVSMGRQVVEAAGDASFRTIMRGMRVGRVRAEKILAKLEAEGAVTAKGPKGVRRVVKVEQEKQRLADEARTVAEQQQQAKVRAAEAHRAPVDELFRAAEQRLEVRKGGDKAAMKQADIAVGKAFAKLEDSFGTADQEMNEQYAQTRVAQRLADRPAEETTAQHIVDLLGVSPVEARRISDKAVLVRKVRGEHQESGEDIAFRNQPTPGEEEVTRRHAQMSALAKKAGKPAPSIEEVRRLVRQRYLKGAREAGEQPFEELPPQAKASYDEARAAGKDELKAATAAAADVLVAKGMARDREAAMPLADAYLRHGVEMVVRDGATEILEAWGQGHDVDATNLLGTYSAIAELIRGPEGRLLELYESGREALQKARELDRAIRDGIITGGPFGIGFIGGSAAFSRLIAQVPRLTSATLKRLWRLGTGTIEQFQYEQLARRMGIALGAFRKLRSSKKQMEWLQRQIETEHVADPKKIRPVLDVLADQMALANEPGLVDAHKLGQKWHVWVQTLADRFAKLVPETDPVTNEHFVRVLEDYKYVQMSQPDFDALPTTKPEDMAAKIHGGVSRGIYRLMAADPAMAELIHGTQALLTTMRDVSAEHLPTTLRMDELIATRTLVLEAADDAVRSAELEAQDAKQTYQSLPPGQQRTEAKKEYGRARDRARARVRTYNKAQGDVQKWMDRRKDFMAAWGRLQEGYFPAISKIERAEADLQAEAKKNVDRRNELLNANILAPLMIAGHWYPKKGALEKAGLREPSAVRSLFHYAREVIPLVHMARWWKENRERIAGTWKYHPVRDIGVLTNKDVYLWQPQGKTGGAPTIVRIFGKAWRTTVVDKQGRQQALIHKGKDVVTTKLPEESIVKKPEPVIVYGPMSGAHPMGVPHMGNTMAEVDGVKIPVSWTPDAKAGTFAVLPGELSGRIFTREGGKFAELRKGGRELAARFAEHVDDVIHNRGGLEATTHQQMFADLVRRYMVNSQLGNFNPIPPTRNIIAALQYMVASHGIVHTLGTLHWGFRFDMGMQRAAKRLSASEMMRGLRYNPGKGPPLIFEAVEKAVQIPAREIARMPKFMQAEAGFYNEAAVALARSPFSASMHIELLGMVARRWREGQRLIKSNWARLRHWIPGIGGSYLKLFAASTRAINNQTYLASYVLARKAGRSTAEAEQVAHDATVSLAASDHRAINSKMAAGMWGRLALTLSNWMIHQSRRKIRYHFVTAPERVARGKAHRAGEFIKRALHTGIRLVGTVQVMQMFGIDPTRMLAGDVSSIPFIGGHVDFAMRQMMALAGLQPNPMDPTQKEPEWRRKAADLINSQEWMPTWIRNIGVDVARKAGSFRGEIPLPIMWGTWSPYMYETFEDLLEASNQWFRGDTKMATKSWNRFLLTMISGSWQRLVRKLNAETDPLQEGYALQREFGTNIVLERVKQPTAWGMAATVFGPDLVTSENWVQRRAAGIRQAREKARAGAQTWEGQSHLMESIDASRKGRDELAKKELEEGLKVFARKIDESGRRWSRGEVRAGLKELVQGARANVDLSSAERDIVHASRNERIGMLAAMLDNPNNPMTEARFANLLQYLPQGRELLKGVDPDIVRDFAEALKRAAPRWKEERKR